MKLCGTNIVENHTQELFKRRNMKFTFTFIISDTVKWLLKEVSDFLG
jgi:hypothetical protein